MTANAKASSCLETGELDGWEVTPGYVGEMETSGSTRLCATVGEDDLARVHRALLDTLKPPFGVLYRQKVDRLDPKPQGHPGRDFVSLEVAPDRLFAALEHAQTLHYRDARGELWVRGGLGEQVVLDQDGTLYVYPDDPAFRDALEGAGLEEQKELVTLEQRDYVRHWFRAPADAEETAFLAAVGLAEVAVQK